MCFAYYPTYYNTQEFNNYLHADSETIECHVILYGTKILHGVKFYSFMRNIKLNSVKYTNNQL